MGKHFRLCLILIAIAVAVSTAATPTGSQGHAHQSEGGGRHKRPWRSRRHRRRYRRRSRGRGHRRPSTATLLIVGLVLGIILASAIYLALTEGEGLPLGGEPPTQAEVMSRAEALDTKGGIITLRSMLCADGPGLAAAAETRFLEKFPEVEDFEPLISLGQGFEGYFAANPPADTKRATQMMDEVEKLYDRLEKECS